MAKSPIGIPVRVGRLNKGVIGGPFKKVTWPNWEAFGGLIGIGGKTNFPTRIIRLPKVVTKKGY